MDHLKADGCSPGYFRLIRCLPCNSICPDNGEDWSNCELQCPEFMTSSAVPKATRQNLTMTTEPQGHVSQLVRSFLEAAWYIPVTHVLPPFVILTLAVGLTILLLYKKVPRAQRFFRDFCMVFKRCGNGVSPPDGADVCGGSGHHLLRPQTLPGMSSVVARDIDRVMSSCNSIANSSQTCVVYLPQPTRDAPAISQIQHTAEVHASLGTLYPTQEVGDSTQHGIIVNNLNNIGYPMSTAANLPVQAYITGPIGQGRFVQSENRNQRQPTSNQPDTFKMETGRRSFDRLPK